MALTSEVVGPTGVYRFLDKVFESPDVVSSSALAHLAEETGVSDDYLSALVSMGLVASSTHGFYLSHLGRRITLLLRAINGEAELSETWRSLTELYPSLRPYQLITEDITGYFVDTLASRPDFIRVYISSPWIKLDEKLMNTITGAIARARERYAGLQVFVLTLPPTRYRDIRALETLRAFRSLGAEIVTHERLHAKLYICEPGPLGGNHFAIFGSENLTGRQNVELAIRVENDNEILAKLRSFFLQIRSEGKFLEEV